MFSLSLRTIAATVDVVVTDSGGIGFALDGKYGGKRKQVVELFVEAGV